MSEKNNNTAILALFSLIIIIGLLFLGVYSYKRYKLSNPVVVTTNMIDNLAKTYKKTIKSVPFFNQDKATKVILNGSSKEYDIDLKGGWDLKNNNLQALISLDKNKSNILYLDGSLNAQSLNVVLKEDSKGYVYNDDFTKIFSFLEETITGINNNDYDKLLTHLNSAINECLKKEDFNKSKEKIIVFDNELGTTKYEITLDKDNLTKIVSNLFKSISKDEDSINSLSKLLSKKYPQASEFIRKILALPEEEIQNAIGDNALIYSIYVSGTNVVKVELKDNKNTFDITLLTYQNDILLGYKNAKNNYGIAYNKKNYKYKILDNNRIIVSGKIEEKNTKNITDLTISFKIPKLKESGVINCKLESIDKLAVKTYNDSLDLKDINNAKAFYEQLEGNEFIDGIRHLFIPETTNWDSVDGIEV